MASRGRALIVGFFSTVGDLECLDVVKKILVGQHVEFDVAPYSGAIASQMRDCFSFAEAKPELYSHLVVVCGPCWPGIFSRHGHNIERFSHCIKIGLNLSMIQPVDTWNPFHLLVERDSERTARPDISFLAEVKAIPVLGLCLIEEQPEYKSQMQSLAISMMRDAAQRSEAAVIEIDTRWPEERNTVGLRSPREVEALIGRLDLLVTNRLHGLVLGLKLGIPVVAVDGVAGGAKVTKQAEALGWPVCRAVPHVDARWIDDSIKWCLTPEAVDQAGRCRSQAISDLQEWSPAFVRGLNGEGLAAPLTDREPRLQPFRRTFIRRLGSRIKALLPNVSRAS